MWSILFGLASGLSARFWLYGMVSILALSIVGGAYFKGRLDCGANVKVAKYQAQIAALQAANKSLRKDAAQALRDAEEVDALERYINELEDTLIDGDCFTAAESDRLRKLWSYGGGK